MKEAIVIYYSYTGNTRKLATRAAEKMDADVLELRDRNRPGKAKAYTAGILAAVRMKRWPIEPVPAKFSGYGKIAIFAPVWAGHLAPEINNVFDWLPEGKDIEVYAVSASGSSSCRDKVKAALENKGCRLARFKDCKPTGE